MNNSTDTQSGSSEKEQLVSLVQAIMASKSLDELNGRFAAFLSSALVDHYQRSESKSEKTPLLAEIRALLEPAYQASGVFRHSLNKPFGYPGDFGILDHVYDRKRHAKSPSAIGGIIDLWALDRPLPRAVSARKDILKEYLRATAIESGRKSTVISLGCGAAREVCELDPTDRQALDITLLDTDPRGMEYAINSIKNLNEDIDIKCIEGDAVKGDLGASLNGQTYDLVYSFGVLDYLPGKYAKALITNCKALMHKESRLLLCIKDMDKYDRWFYDLMFDWRFVGRTAKDGRELMEANGLQVTREFRAQEGVIVVYECVLGS